MVAVKRKRNTNPASSPLPSKRPLSSTSRPPKAEDGVKAEGEVKRELKTRTKQKQDVKDEVKEEVKAKDEKAKDNRLSTKKHSAWSQYTSQSPFPDFPHPTPEECRVAHARLKELHQEAVEAEFADENTPETIPHVLDAMIIAILSQATAWSNAKRAMNSMKKTYGSIFAYDKIVEGGQPKLAETIRCGGMHNRKSMIIMTVLDQVYQKAGKYDLDDLFNLDDEEAMKELLSYKYMGTKSASVVMGWSLKRNPFTVDTHVYRLAGLWGWRPKDATREKTQSHLEIMIPPNLKFDLHFLMIQHGRTCPACRGGSKGGKCTLKGGKALPENEQGDQDNGDGVDDQSEEDVE
jgi:endonuclease-3